MHIIGDSPAVVELRAEIGRVARSDVKVLITGEAGSGKEVVARAIHQQSARAARPLVTVNCAGLPETLLESELFGHVRGSFTGAYRDKPGLLESAHEGTIFLDEVGEMPLRMQALFLRFLETAEIHKVGGAGQGRTVDVRVLAATNHDLQRGIADGTFREDLFYRLNVIHIGVPPLRERSEDIPLLVEHFLEQFGDSKQPVQLTSDDMKALTSYPWPGNVRELKNVIERIVVTGRFDSRALVARDSKERPVPQATVSPAFEIEFSERCTPVDVKAVLTALADYYRSCGGVGFKVDFETADVTVREAVGV